MTLHARHHWRRTWFAVAAVAVTTVAVTVGAPATGAPATATGATATPTHSVTLITGDRVSYGERPGASPLVEVTPADRSDGSTPYFLTMRTADGVYVLPSDARQQVDSGALDRELFNVKELVREGVADNATSVPVIVTYRDARSSARQRSSALAATTSVRELPSVNGAAMRVDTARAAQFWAALHSSIQARSATLPVAKVWLDRRVSVRLDQSVPQVGAPAAWQAGYDGTGVTVGVLDTGIDATHPDLAGKVVAAQDFTDEGTMADGVGHGTHVASILAGTGTGSAGRYKGVAPGARLVVGRVLDSSGYGLDSWVIAGMEWIAPQVPVVSMSLGEDSPTGGGPVTDAVNDLTAKTGTLFVVAAGNSGPAVSIASPADADGALAVGAVDKKDQFAPFSSRGPRFGDGAVKPNISAPGVNIVAARAAGTSMGDPVNDLYTSASGTSMATPHVAGAAAILAEQHPGWHAADLRQALVSSAQDVGGPWHEEGSGRLDVARAVRQQVRATDAVSFGRLSGDAAPVTAQLNYTNDSPDPVTLALAPSLAAYTGAALPAGTAVLAASSVTVPAHGAAAVGLTVDARTASVGSLGGVVTARTADGSVQLRTPVSAYRAPDTVALTLRMTDFRGKPVADGLATLLDLTAQPSASADPFAVVGYSVPIQAGVGTVRVPRGDVYSAMMWTAAVGVDVRRYDVLVSDEITPTTDATLSVDGSTDVPLGVSDRQPTDQLFHLAQVIRGGAEVEASIGAGTNAEGSLFTPGYRFYVTPVGPARTGFLTLQEKWVLADPALTARTSPAGTVLHPDYRPFAVRAALPGYHELPVVLAGQGADVRGKLVLVPIQVPAGMDPVSYASTTAVQAAADAAAGGALATAPYVQQAGALPITGLRDQPLAQLSLSDAEGEALRAQLDGRTVTVQLNSQSAPGSMVDLFYHQENTRAVEHPVDRSRLVRIPTTYHANSPTTYVHSWFAFGPHAAVDFSPLTRFTAPAGMVEFVGPADNTVLWHRETGAVGGGQQFAMETFDRYPPGQDARPDEHWFRSPVLQYAVESASSGNPIGIPCGLCRSGPDGNLFIPPWFFQDSDPSHYIQSWPDYQSTVRMFQGGKEIAANPMTVTRPYPTFTLGAGPGVYTLVDDGPVPAQPGAVPLPQRASTTWTFHSDQPTAAQHPDASCQTEQGSLCVFQPLLQLRYQLDLGQDNTTPGGRPFTFGVTAGMHSGVPNPAPVTALQVSASTDSGATWQPAREVSLGDGRYDVTVAQPDLPIAQVWLHVRASDAAGNTVDQTVQNVYRLTPAGSTHHGRER
ncbi:S8 family peptidase [Solihabitans fulvus]|uniref:S8 family peptidase n=1 Tax=Solihabitans fulvus TaxID=1892852 RepID=A0A5B2WXH8_9PSEU|nr:S8 family peptidase [Solihabitans fulvus]KAA2254657.1 S8 family peptidase [Solihabitans fulvus]